MGSHARTLWGGRLSTSLALGQLPTIADAVAHEGLSRRLKMLSTTPNTALGRLGPTVWPDSLTLSV